jgi:fibronectin-binding autotransporter adhesin
MDGGTLQIGNLVTLADRAITLNPGGGTFSLDQISYLTVTNDIRGVGALIKAGPGALVLKGAVTSTGSIAVQDGTLYVDGAMSGPGNLTVYSGGTLGGSGSILGELTVQDGGTLAPGTNDVHGPSTLTVSNLTLSPNSILRMDLNRPGAPGGTNDLLLVRGNLTLDGILKVTGNGTNGIYPLIKYDGVLTNNGMQMGPAVNGTLIVDTTNQIINLNAVSFPPAPPAPMRLFFVGNSLTYTYDIPGTLAGMTAAANDSFTYNADLVGGSTNTPFFGSSGQSYWDPRFAGLLDEVSLYDRALSADEISLISAAGAAGKCREAAVTVQPRNQTVAAGSSVVFTSQRTFH